MTCDYNRQEIEGVVGHHFLNTRDAKWLGLEDIYQKFHRPNAYDIGGTNVDDVADYWFMYMTKFVADIYLLELFISSHHEQVFTVCLSNSNNLIIDKKSDIVYLDSYLKDFQVKKERDVAVYYLTTFSFTQQDVDLLKNKKLYIRVCFKCAQHTDGTEGILDVIKSHHDFGALLDDPIDADFTIESSDGEKFKVHKVLLATQSEVFKAMLKEETAESQNSYVKLVDVCKEDLKCILEFIYTGTLKELSSCNCYDILMLADRYNLNGLKILMQHALCYQITHENALEILVLADMYNAGILKTSALKFIKRYTVVLENNVFDEINNAELVRELCKFIAK